MVFLLDSSSSVGRPNFHDMLDFVVGVLRDADIDDGQIRIGAMTFGLAATEILTIKNQTIETLTDNIINKLLLTIMLSFLQHRK